MNRMRSLAFISFLFVLWLPSSGQKKEIPIDPDLAANSNVYRVKSKAHSVGKMPKYRFGPFKVLTSKSGWTKTSRTSKIWSSKAETLSENKFSFVLFNGQSDTATVNALSIIVSTYTKSTELLSSDRFSFSVGEDALVNGTELFTASINTSFDPADDWVLRIEATEDETRYQEVKTVLENGERIIALKHVNSPYADENGGSRYPALGYEFTENGIPLGAVKYFPGMIGYKNVWFRSTLDERTKLLISAASATILHLKGD